MTGKNESEIENIFSRIDTMGLNELYELLKVEWEDAKEEGYDLPLIKFRGESIDVASIIDIVKYGINVKVDLRYIISNAYKPLPQYQKVRVPFYGYKDFGVFMDEIEDRKVLLKRILKQIFKPRGGDLGGMPE
ncbi:hypothetical protein GF336_00380 [Candidatus Woesearchaeota archaeon]|nr:hypothetical protein [Candidatus Woesearchaeota archaeon]